MWPFSIFFKNKDSEVPEERYVYDIGYVRNVIYSKRTNLEKSFVDLALTKHKKIKAVANEMERKLEAFDTSNLGEDKIDPRLLHVFLGNKKTLSKRLHEICDTVKTPVEGDKSSVIGYFNNSYSVLKEAMPSSMVNYAKIEDHFDKLAVPIFRDANFIAASIEAFMKEISNFQKENAEIDSIGSLVNEIESLTLKKTNLQNKKHDLGNELENARKEKTTIESRLNDLVKSDAYKSFQKLENEREELKRRLGENKSAFVNYLAPLNKSLRKFLKLVGDNELIFENKECLEKFIESHELTEEALPLMKDAVVKIKSVMDRLELKDDAVKKVVGRINDIISHSTLDKIYQDKLDIMESLISTESKISASMPHEKFELEGIIKRLESKINSIENEFGYVEKEAASTESKVIQYKQELNIVLKDVTGISDSDIRLD